MGDARFEAPGSVEVDDLIEASREVRIRQDLALVALGKRPRRQGAARRPFARRPYPQLARGLGDRHQGPAHRLGRPGGRILGRGRRALPRARSFRGPGLRRGAQAHRELASDAGMGSGAGAAARQYLDLRGEPRILQRQRPAQSRILAGGAQARLAAEDLPAAGLGGAAHGLRMGRRPFRLRRAEAVHGARA